MRLPFRRRKIIDKLADGLEIEWTIPFDPDAVDDADALVRHIERFSHFSPEALAALMSTRLGSLIFGRIRFIGSKPGIDSLGNFDELVEAIPGPLSDEEYEEMMFGGSPLQREVYRRLKAAR